MKSLARWMVIGWILSSGAVAMAQTPAVPAGVAQQMGEAPGRAPLAPMPPDTAAPTSDPAHERSMAFSAGGAECRETVPGGTMLAVAYAIVIGVLGLYVAWVAWKSARIVRSVEDLEARIERAGASKGSAT